MYQHRKFRLMVGLVLILFAVIGTQPAAVSAALPLGITPTPTNTPEDPTPTSTPEGPVVPPPPATETPTPVPTATDTPEAPPPEAPPPTSRRATATPVVLLPATGDIPPDSPFGGLGFYAILLIGIVIGLLIGLGSKILFSRRGRSWIDLFLSLVR